MLHHILSFFDSSPDILQVTNVLAQVTDPSVNTPEEAALIFSGPQFFVALFSGLVLAFGFQLLLTNLSVAAGISYLGARSDSHDSSSSDSVGGSVRKIGFAVGAWTLITVTLALFIACLLAIKLSLIQSSLLGAIVGLVIWGAYFTLLVWVSSTTVGSLVGSVVNAATSGLQAIVGTATAALGAKATQNQIISTAEEAAAAVRRELMSGLDPQGIRENFEDYLNRLRPADLNWQKIQHDFEQLLNDPELKNLALEGDLSNIDRKTFVDLVSSRTDLSKREVNQIADRLESVWRKTVGKVNPSNSISDLMGFLRSANPGQLLSNELSSRLEQFTSELRSSNKPDTPNAATQILNGLIGVVVGRADLSDLDVERTIQRLKETQSRLGEQANQLLGAATQKSAAPSYSVVRADVEDYLLNTYVWQLTPQQVERNFREVLYDPDADATQIRRELEQLEQSTFTELLNSRGLFTQDEIRALSFQLEKVRREVLKEAIAREDQEKTALLRERFIAYLRLAPKETLLNSGTLNQDLKPIFQDSDTNLEHLRARLSRLDHSTLVNLLTQRNDLNAGEVEQIANEIERITSVVLADAEGVQQGAKVRAETQWSRLQEYLRSTGKEELNPEGIKRDLQTLLHDPQAGIHDLRVRLSHFDRDTLVQLLSQRQDLNEGDVNRILDDVEGNWHRTTHAPQIVSDKASEQYDNVTSSLAEYLRNTGKEELNPEGINRDLKLLVDNPKEGLSAWRDRLSHVDRDTLVKLLSQRQDLSEAEVNQVIDNVLLSLRSITRAPRRLATRTQQNLRDFQSTLADYLKNTGKEELNPRGIERDLQLLLSDPRLGIERLSDRLSHIDRSTVVALLSQRKDMTEEEANRVVDQVLSVRERVMVQVQQMQQRIQLAIESVLNKIRNYLNSLERPELNYEGITHDIRTLFDDPQAGFDALRDRLSHFDRGTLVALLSSREDISQTDAERIIDRVERARNSVLQRAERVQEQVQRRLYDIKHQTQLQVEATRKAAATAAWWLFATALTSALASAFAGSLAVG